MGVTLHLGGPEELGKLLPMVAAHHAEAGIGSDEAHRRAAVEPLLGGSPYGAVWLAGPKAAPLGYVIVSFGWSVGYGGMEAFLDELFVRPRVRGRGIGGAMLAGLLPRLEGAGVRAIHLGAALSDAKLLRLAERAGFERREGYCLTTREARRVRAEEPED